MEIIDKEYGYKMLEQIGNVCGKKHPEMKIVKKNPKQEYLICDCGNRMQRDLNAAKNILNEGLKKR